MSLSDSLFRAAHGPRLRLLVLPVVMLCAACQSKLQVDLAVAAPAGASNVVLTTPTVNLRKTDGNANTYDTGYPDAIDLLPYSSDDADHSDRLKLIDKDNVTGSFDGVRPNFDTTGAYVQLSSGTHVPISLGSQADYAAISLSLDKTTSSGNDSADLVLTLELPFSLIDRTSTNDDYLLTPVIRVVDKSKAGTISGTIAAGLVSGSACGSAAGSGVAVYVYNGAGVTPVDYYNDGTNAHAYQPLASSLLTYDSTNNDYSFEIRYLPVGSYTVAWTCKASSDSPNTDDDLSFQANPQTTSVSAGSIATVTFD